MAQKKKKEQNEYKTNNRKSSENSRQQLRLLQQVFNASTRELHEFHFHFSSDRINYNWALKCTYLPEIGFSRNSFFGSLFKQYANRIKLQTMKLRAIFCKKKREKRTIMNNNRSNGAKEEGEKYELSGSLTTARDVLLKTHRHREVSMVTMRTVLYM